MLFSFPQVTVISPDFSSGLHALVYGFLIISSQLSQGILKNEFLVSEWHLHPSVYTCHKPRSHPRSLSCPHSPIHSIIGLFLFHFLNISGIYEFPFLSTVAPPCLATIIFFFFLSLNNRPLPSFLASWPTTLPDSAPQPPVRLSVPLLGQVLCRHSTSPLPIWWNPSPLQGFCFLSPSLRMVIWFSNCEYTGIFIIHNRQVLFLMVISPAPWASTQSLFF